MSNGDRIELKQELLDDFHAEADEHLLGIRRELLQLGASADHVDPDPQAIENLFQHFHSFKGISAIVGLTPAESLAHSAEGFLRLLKQRRLPFTPGGLETLQAVPQKLEQIVAAFRVGKPLPESDSLRDAIQRQCEDSSAEPASSLSSTRSPESSPTGGNQPPGTSLWKCTFSPSRELNDQGVNVNAVREELSKHGEILKCIPVVRGQGVVVFEFLVAAKTPLVAGPEWAARGIAVELGTAAAPDSPGGASDLEAAHNPFLAPSHTVRVNLKLLDDLMRVTGELVIHRSRLDTQLARLDAGAGHAGVRGVQEASTNLGRSLRELRESIMRVRMVPASEIFSRMPFVVRDLVRQTGKEVRLKVEGQDTAMDKYLIERLKDPLLHLVRNAFSHGVETTAERVSAGKPAEATIELSAAAAGNSILIRVRDDGRGIDPAAIVQRAKKLGLEVPERIDDAAILKILCASGFSTRDDADRASGRGIGMAVVQTTVRELGGSLTMASERGRGTTFTLRLPLTLAILETLIVRAAGQTCAVPQNFVREIVPAKEELIETVDGIEVLPYRNGVLPITRLAGIFKLDPGAGGKMCVLVIESDQGSAGLLVETVLGQREVVVRALADPLIQIEGLAGAAELGDGKPILILDCAALTRGSIRPWERVADE